MYISNSISYSVFGFIKVIDSFEWDHLWGIVVTQPTENDAISQCLL